MLFKKNNNVEKIDILEEDRKVVNNIRCLALDMINEAKSGHPGMVLDCTPALYTLYSRHLNIDIDNTSWFNRDRFVLSSGHTVPMLYSVLYMLGLLELDDCKKLRQLGSKTPGHPEIETNGIDMNTGPLGQGVATSVGMAMGERYLNTINSKIFNHYTYCLCGDGDLQEGISYEALSLAGKFKLNKFILIYDNNNCTLDANLDKSSNEDTILRFRSIGFNVYTVLDPENIKEIDSCFRKAKNSDKPSVIVLKSIIGKYSVNEGSNVTHGKPLDLEDISNIKNKLNIIDTPFTVSSESVEYFKNMVLERTKPVINTSLRNFSNLKEKEQLRLNKIIDGDDYVLDNIDLEYEGLALRDINGNILNLISKENELIIGGSADLSSSTKTNLKDETIFDYNNYNGRNIYYGIREHAMGAISNGLALMGLRPFCSTFLVFSDYLRPAIRMSAMMDLPVLYIFTHDSITVGEDGKTHEPIEQLYSLDLIPNLNVYHPFDVNELIDCYKEIIKSKKPSVIVLPRDSKEVSELTKANKINRGAYILKKEETEDYIVLVSSGESIKNVLEISEELKMRGIDSRVVSMPVFNNFINTEENYKEYIFPKDKLIIGYTYGSINRFLPFTNHVIGMNSYGLSGKKEDLINHFKLDKDSSIEYIMNLLGEKDE